MCVKHSGTKSILDFRYSACVCVLLVQCQIAVVAQSLYREENFRSPVADIKSSRVGDILTIQVFESSSATSSADTSTQRKSNFGIGVAISPSRQKNGSLSSGGDFDGGGTTQRSNRLLATLSVTVREALPNGDLRISGEQLLKVNEEQHRVHVEGRVRPQDISDANLVVSTRIADAKITYVGTGDLSEQQKQGFWRSLLAWFGLK